MNSRAKILHKEHESTDPSYLVLTVQAASGGLMVFGNIFSVHFERLSTSRVQFKHYRLPEYYSSPWPFLCSTVWFLFPAVWHSISRNSIFSNWFLNHGNGFTVVAWPPQSPHLNPVEQSPLESEGWKLQQLRNAAKSKPKASEKGCSVRCWVYPFKSCDSYDGTWECK